MQGGQQIQTLVCIGRSFIDPGGGQRGYEGKVTGFYSRRW